MILRYPGFGLILGTKGQDQGDTARKYPSAWSLCL